MADKLPSFQFYPGDWRKAPEVQACSFAARGLWLEMLCLMFESPRRGYLELNGRPVTAEQIARMTGGAPAEVAALLSELEAAGVFSRDDRGVIFSRRLDREQRIRNVRSAAGKLGAAHGHKGGRPRKETGSEIENPNNPPLTANVDLAVSKNAGNSRAENGKNGKANGKITPSSSSSSSSEYIPAVAGSVVSERTQETRSKRPDACPLFARFWAAFPNRVDKPAAVKAWAKLNVDDAMLAVILAGLRKYTAAKPDWQAWKHPGPWLNARRWEDECATGPPGEANRLPTAAEILAMDAANADVIHPLTPSR